MINCSTLNGRGNMPAKRRAKKKTTKKKATKKKTTKKKVARKKKAAKVKKVRCAATTKDGKRCKRFVSGKSKFCYLHKGGKKK